MVLFDMAEDTVLFLEGMSGGPVIVIVFIVVTVAAPDTAEVKRDGDALAAIHAPEQEVLRCIGWHGGDIVDDQFLFGELEIVPAHTFVERVVYNLSCLPVANKHDY